MSKAPIPGFKHAFCTLATGFKLHYLVNKEVEGKKGKNVVVFIHGMVHCSFFVWTLQLMLVLSRLPRLLLPLA